MHLPRGEGRALGASEEAVDLGQTPGEIVVLSAADTDIAGLAAARRRLPDDFPATRLANWMALGHPLSVDLYSDRVLAQARIVVIRLLGGASYWSYGVEEAQRVARARRSLLVVVPGDQRWDAEVACLSTVPLDAAERLWRCFAEGGVPNLERALRYAASLIGAAPTPDAAERLPTAGLYDLALPPLPSEAPTAAIVFYRSLVQAGQVAPVEALGQALARRGMRPLAVFVSSLKDAADAAFVEDVFDRARPGIVLNATAFALSGFESASGTILDGGSRPVLQVTFAGTSEAEWRASTRGLSPKDLVMNVVLPEVDGRIITRAVSFKEGQAFDPLTECSPAAHRPLPDRVEFVAELANRWVRLGRTPAADKRVAIVLSNYPSRDGRMANGVGLDAPASTAVLIEALAEAGYQVEGAPRSAEALIGLLLSGPTNAAGRERAGGVTLRLADYERFFKGLPPELCGKVEARWGPAENDPFVRDGAFALAAHRFGNVAIGLQPARGYDLDPATSYHDPALVPPHAYFAFHAWLREGFGAHALVHMGKHGNAEWLPGKALALSAECFPEAALGAMPLVYPFIVNDPGEGAQAKRRTAAVVVDHLMPPMVRAESHGAAAELETLIDEYAAASAYDPRRAGLVAAQARDLARAHGFDRDLGIRLDGDDALARLDEHVCDLKDMQIRGSLHVLGQSPQGELRAETIVALTRLPRGGSEGDASILRALAADLDLDGFDPLAPTASAAWEGPRPPALAAILPPPWRSEGDTVERLEALALDLVRGRAPEPGWRRTKAVLGAIRDDIAPRLDVSGPREIAAVLDALAGRFVPPGPSGAPTRGRPDCLPSGRNFFSVDVRAVPTRAAYDLGKRSADLLLTRYLQEEGEWPKALALSAWGTANMRTGGDDIAQALALLGVRPAWQAGTQRVEGVEVVPLSELGRPRVDVTLRISGFFRDAFPTQIALFHEAVAAVSERDEPADANPVRARIREDAVRLIAEGLGPEEARRVASFRVFGSMPGAYGAGLQTLIESGVWAERRDLAEAFLEWSAYAYGVGAEGTAARGALETRLAAVDLVLHNQDNREHDLLDSDDYYQFMGGLAASVESLRGRPVPVYHGDHSRPERPVVRTLRHEIGRVVTGRAANPKWIAGMMRHGYKGAFEMAATVDYLFAFAATTDAVGNHHFEQLYAAYIEDEEVRGFMARHNPPALAETASRFLEAEQRGLWTPRRNSAHDTLLALASGAAEDGP